MRWRLRTRRSSHRSPMRRCNARVVWPHEELREQRCAHHTAAPRTADPTWASTRRSAGELAGQHHAEAVASVFQPPAARWRKTLPVTFTQVVRVRVGGIGKVVDPHRRCGVLIRERHRRRVVATGTRATTAHVTKVPILRGTSVDFPLVHRLSMTTWRTSLPHLHRRLRLVDRNFRATSFAAAATENVKACRGGRSGRFLHSRSS